MRTEAAVNKISGDSILKFINPDTDSERIRELEEEVLKEFDLTEIFRAHRDKEMADGDIDYEDDELDLKMEEEWVSNKEKRAKDLALMH